jgi:uncharacterized repeat protein (TIGR03803 family)
VTKELRRIMLFVGLLGLCWYGAELHAQTFKVIYNLATQTGDPTNPSWSGIISQGRDGNLYSTANQAGGGFGAAFKVTPAGVFTVLASFTGANGEFPSSGLTLNTNGNYYGTTSGGGFTPGTIFNMTSTGTVTTLYDFMNTTDGQTPVAPPIQGTDNNLYGTVSSGTGIYGTIYKLTPSNTFTVLHTFDFTTGAFPQAPLVQGTDGAFYGTTELGTTSNEGNVFKITSAGKFTQLFSFDVTHGANPFGPLVQGSDGNFYGTTRHAGTGDGTVFKITPQGSVTVLHNFTGTGDGVEPTAGLVLATDGNFYGVTSQATGSSGCGTIFRITPRGTFTTLFTFPADKSMGCNPLVTMVQHTNGILYGDTCKGGTGNAGDAGVIFSFNLGLAPFVSLVTTSGKIGTTVEILGQGFTGTTAVSFNGVSATFTVVSDTYMTAKIPAAATTGFVTVATPSSVLTSSKKFRITPQILSFSPTSGSIGTSVTITGAGLTQTTKVTFGGVTAASFTVNADTNVTAIVPTGAKTGKIAITTPGGTAQSATNFTVTP